MIGVLPCAGFGSRLSIPYAKELLGITEKDGYLVTVVESNLLQLAEAGIDRAVIVTRPGKPELREYLGPRRYGVSLAYVDQASYFSREGLPDAVTAARPIAPHEDLTVMLMGDVYLSASNAVKTLVHAMNARTQAVAGVGTYLTGEPQRFGVVESETRWVSSVQDKPRDLPKGVYAHWGAVAFRPNFWDYLVSERATFSNALHRCATDNPFTVLSEPMPGRFFDLGTPMSYLGAVAAMNRAL